MLAGVSGEYKAALVPLDQANQFAQVVAANLASLVQDDDGAGRQPLCRKGLSEGLSRQIVHLKVANLLALGCQDDHRASGRSQAAFDFLQSVAFSDYAGTGIVPVPAPPRKSVMKSRLPRIWRTARACSPVRSGRGA